jgi:hypothetical protein
MQNGKQPQMNFQPKKPPIRTDLNTSIYLASAAASSRKTLLTYKADLAECTMLQQANFTESAQCKSTPNAATGIF